MLYTSTEGDYIHRASLLKKKILVSSDEAPWDDIFFIEWEKGVYLVDGDLFGMNIFTLLGNM